MRCKHGFIHLVAWILLLAGLHGASADLQYTNTTSFKIAGAVGQAISFMAKLGGAPAETVEKVYVKGDWMLSVNDDKKTLTDLANKRFVHLDDSQKTYMEIPFGMPAGLAQSYVDGAQQNVQMPAEAPDDEPRTEVEVDFDVEVERTGKTKKIDGNKAERVLSTVKVEFKGETAPADSSEEVQSFEGTIVIASELWMSAKVKGLQEAEDFRQRLGAAMMGEMGIQPAHSAAVRDAMMGDPRIGKGLEKAAEQTQKIKGIELASTTHTVLVPAGLEYDPGMVWVKKKKKGGFGGFAKKLAAEAAKAKVGLETTEGAEGEEAPPKQTILMTVKKKIEKIKTKKLKDKRFAIPADYTPVKLPVQM